MQNLYTAAAKAQGSDANTPEGIAPVTKQAAATSSSNYVNATEAVKLAYDEALANVNAVANKAGANKSAEEVNALISALNTAEGNLNGISNKASWDNDLKAKVDQLDNLNNAQKQDIKDLIDATDTLSESEAKFNDAKELNKVMGELNEEIKKEAQLTQSDKFVNSTNQDVYTDALKDAKAKAKNDNLTQKQATELKQTLANAANDLNGDSQLQTAKNNAKQQIDTSDLTQGQKTALDNEVDSKTKVSDVNNVITSSFTPLVKAMNTLAESIKQAKAAKATQDYLNASKEQKDDFDTKLAAAEKLQEASSNVTTPAEITSQAALLDNAKTALNGDENFATAVKALKAKIQASILNNAQQKALIDKIDEATTNYVTLPDIETEFNTLTKAMQDLSQTRSKIAQNRNGSFGWWYKWSTQDARVNLSKEVNKIDELFNKEKGANLDATAVSELQKAAKTKERELITSAEAGFKNAIKAGKEAINANALLNDAQKNKFIAKLDNLREATASQDEINAQVTAAEELNSAAQALKAKIAQGEAFAKTTNYSNGTEDAKTALDTALSNAKTLFEPDLSKLANQSVAKKQLEDKSKAIQDAMDTLIAQAKTLDEYKALKAADVQALSDLSDKQKQTLIKEINNANSHTAVNDVVQKATTLDSAMNKLKQAEASIGTTQASKDYLLATPAVKDAYDAAANAINDAKTAGYESTDAAAINALTNALNNVKLDGNNNLATAKQAIQDTPNLNDAQKAKLNEKLDEATSKAQLDARTKQASDLSKAIATLNTKVAQGEKLAARLATPQNATIADQAPQLEANKQAKDNLDAQIKTAKTLTESNNITVNDFADAKLTNAISSAQDQINASGVVLENALVKANEITLPTKELSNAIAAAQVLQNAYKAENSTTPAFDALSQADALKKAIAKDALKKAIKNVPNKLAENESFKNNVLNDAQNTLQNPDASVEDINSATDKLNDGINKENLYNAVANANDNATKPLSKELQDLINADTNLLPYDKANKESKEQYDAKADALNKAVAKNNLDNTITSANNIQNPSDKLKQAIKSAQEVSSNPSASEKQLSDVTKALQDAINKEPLNKAIQDANNKLNNLTGDGSKDLNNKLTDAIKQAEKVANNSSSTPEQIAKATEDLNKAVEEIDKAIKQNKTDLDNALTQANEINPKSDKLQEAIKQATDVKNNPEANNSDVKTALDNLKDQIAKNDLNNAIQNAPELTKPVDGFTPSVDASKSIANNPKATVDQINDQTTKQRLNNDQINALNQIEAMQNLNDAQKTVLKANVASAKTQQAVVDVLSKATALNKSMDELNKYLNSLPNDLTSDPITSETYAFADKAQQQAYTTALDKAQKLVNKAQGGIYKDNLASDVDSLLTELQQAKDTMLANGQANKDNYADQLAQAQKQIDALKETINSPAYNAAPSTLQNNLTQAVENAQKQLDALKANTAADAKGLGELKTTLAQGQSAQSQINKFANEQPIADWMQENANVLNNNIVSQATTDFNNATTFEAAKAVKDKTKAQNQEVANAINQLVTNLDNDVKALPTVINDLDQTQTNLNNIKQNAKEDISQALEESFNAVKALNDLNKAIDAYLNASFANESQVTQAQNNLTQAIANAKEVTTSNNTTAQLNKDINDAIAKLSKYGNNTISVANNLKNSAMDANALAQANEYAQSNAKFKALLDQLQANNYFEIMQKDKDNFTKQDVQAIQNILTSDAFKDANNIFKSAIKSDIKANANHFPWWAYLVIVSALTWIGAIILMTFKK
ncbi:hypothetical protein Q8852_00940 [Mycoplasma seminis]|uniref:Extracellular matrix-binding protein ebh GA module domain-containing protein n=2 Tax=Mycoplasma seminis TaxID=512749 RepID=A0ABY9HAZ6_9MOLU|nr:hypothetical protein [Mycoplasma seminis]WLP85707.1 hypothetical protein Q8852_00940 [Mycoplasma seminis]